MKTNCVFSYFLTAKNDVKSSFLYQIISKNVTTWLRLLESNLPYCATNREIVV